MRLPASWAEHQRADNEPYTDGVTAEALIERVEGLRTGTLGCGNRDRIMLSP